MCGGGTIGPGDLDLVGGREVLVNIPCAWVPAEIRTVGVLHNDHLTCFDVCHG